MVALLSRIFIKNRQDYAGAKVRKAYGTLCSVLGIILNLLLFAFKYFAGVLTHSIAITTDAFNNLSDGLSSAITLAGFVYADKKPDAAHPFGHGRIEYLSALAVACLIIVMGFDLLKSSIKKIVASDPVTFGSLSAIILIVSIGIKLYMFSYNRRYGKRISSDAMRASGTDSLMDCATTTAVLVSMIIGHFTKVNIDAWTGILVSCLILATGIRTVNSTLSPLLGVAPGKEFVDSVYNIVLAHEEFLGVHDLIVHDYGPGRRFISLHGEMSGETDLFVLHDCIDRTENELEEKLGCFAVIHLDPVEPNNALTAARHGEVQEIVKGIDPRITIHDFRVITGADHTKLVFDAVVPFGFKLSDEAAKTEIQTAVSSQLEDCTASVKIDKPLGAFDKE